MANLYDPYEKYFTLFVFLDHCVLYKPFTHGVCVLQLPPLHIKVLLLVKV